MKNRVTMTVLGAASAVVLSACGGLTNSSTDTAATGAPGSVSTAGCVDPAAATAVIKDQVNVGWTVPLSGPFGSVWNLVDSGFRARMQLFNDAGGAKGVKVNFFTTDSKQNPEVAKALTNEMIQKDGADIVFTTGSAQVATMVDDAAAACVPMIAAAANSAVYRDPAKYPWVTLYLPPVTLEAKAVVQAAQAKFPDGAKVALAVSASESGKLYAEAYREAVKGTNLTIVQEATVADPNAAATTLKASGATVLFGGAVATECLSLTNAISRVGWKPTVYQNATCADTSLYAPAGVAADGQIVFKYEVLPALDEFKGQPEVLQYIADAKKSGLANPMSNWSVTGWSIGEVYADVLTRAAASKDGLSRLSIMQAAREQDFHPSTLIKGINFKTTGGASGITGLQPFTWNAAKANFVPSGDPVIVQ